MSALVENINAWLEANYWLVESTFIILLTIAAFMLWNKVQRKIHDRSKNTDTKLDDILIQAFSLPLSLLIILTGGYQTLSRVSFFFIDYPGGAKMFSTISQTVVLIIFFWILLRIINSFELHYRQRKIKVGDKELNPATLHGLFQSLRAIIFIAAVLAAMEAFGLSVSGLLTFGGIGGILIGFAAKDTLANFFSGLLIFWERPFVVGDWIRRPDAGIEGVVENIGWRMTQIRTFDHRPLYVPNSLFFNSVIENPQRMTNRRIYEYMGVRYDDIAKMQAMLGDIRTMLDNHPDIDQDKIKMVNFDRYGQSSLDFFIYAMTKTTDWAEFHRVKEEILLKVADIVSRHGCEFAFPTRTLHHVGLDATAPPLPMK